MIIVKYIVSEIIMHTNLYLLGNVAYLKRTKVSTPHGDFDASYAVDGVIVTGAGDNAVAWNTDTTSPAWWMVDLGSHHRIYHIYIYNTNSKYILPK